MTKTNNEIQIALKYHQSGQFQKAESIYSKVLQANPNHSHALNLLGGLLHQMGDSAKAVKLIKKAIMNNPQNPDFQYNLGVVLHALGKLEDANMAYRQTLRLKPDYTRAWCNLGIVLREQGQLDDAIGKFKKALQLMPDSAEILNNLGNVLKEQGLLDDAIEKFKKALQIRPDYAEAWSNFGSAMLDKGQFKTAIENCRQAIRLRPEYAEAWNNLGCALGRTGKLESAVYSCRQALRYKPDFVEAHSYLLFLLSYNVMCSPVDILEEHRDWERIHGGEKKAHTFTYPGLKGPDKRLKIGYVSSDLCQHPVSSFFGPILKNHNKNQVEIFCYSGVTRPDSVTERLKAMSDTWRTIAGISDEESAQMIHDDNIDILIDLAGHTTKNRLKVFTYKPAPVQATYIGYCTTTGLSAMDYWITDETLHPEDTVELAVETIIRLPRCWICYQPPANAPNVEHKTRTDGNITFGSFNNFAKITPDVISCWGQILKELPNSRLILKTHQLADPLLQETILKGFVSHGIAKERIILLPGTSSYLDVYNDVDIALDTFPRTGGVTTADALWMGVPVVTFVGQRYIERQGASILKAVGLEELVATTLEDYISTSVLLAKDHDRRFKLQESLRERMANSPLCDGRSLSQALEDAYRRMWHNWSETQIPSV